MGSTRYQLTGRKNTEFTARLLYVSSSIYEGDWPSLRHNHSFTELFYIRGGRGHFIVGDETLPVAQDDLIIINPNVEHTEVSVNSDPLEYVVLGVEGIRFSLSRNSNYAVYNYGSQRESLLFYFNALLNEIEHRNYAYELACQDLLEVLLIRLNRNAHFSFGMVSGPQTSHECSRVKAYIDSNLAEDITLEKLAKMVNLNKDYLAHTFHVAYGFSPITYLNEKRIQCSKELLESTDHSIAGIAQLAGFSSQSYFAQSFRKACGMTAGAYRRLARAARSEKAGSKQGGGNLLR